MLLLSKEFKKDHSYLAHKLFVRCIYKSHKGKPLTIHKVYNWLYDRAKSLILEEEFKQLLMESNIPIPEDAFKKELVSDE